MTPKGKGELSNLENLVTVCIPVYNGAKTIEETVKSVIAQTYKNIEILIIDNCSVDNTVQLVKQIDDKRIVFYQNETNIGMAGNWNECLKKARGEFVHFLCADDIITPDCIEKKVRMITSDENICMVTGATDIINENGKVIMKRSHSKKDMITDGTALAKKSLHSGNLYGEPSNVMFRRSLTEKAGLFADNLSYTTDWEYWVRLSVFGKVGFLSEALTKYRVSCSNVTSQMNIKKILEDDDRMMENLLKYEHISIDKKDIILHKAVITLRDYARVIYMKLMGR